MNLPINSELEHINKNHKNIINTHITNNIDISGTFWFLMALRIADIPANIRKIHNIISKKFQKAPGAKTVTIQQTINVIANHNIAQNGHSFFISKNWKIKDKYLIRILWEKSNIHNYKKVITLCNHRILWKV